MNLNNKDFNLKRIMHGIVATVLCLIVTTLKSHAQNGRLNLEDKKKIILFLISKNEIVSDDNNWKANINSISYKEVYKSNTTVVNGIYIFNSLSPHATYYILLKDANEFKILEASSFESDFTFFIAFFNKNAGNKNHGLLSALKSIFEIYQLNKKNNWMPEESRK